MTTLSQLLRSLGILVFLFACASKPPNLQDALDLYREGHINEARRDMVAYIKAKPFNPESEDARQHILLIRRIKQLESIAIAQWERSNIEGAKKIVGIIRILHPVYVDSAAVYQLIDFSQPPKWVSSSETESVSIQFGQADPSSTELIPFAIQILHKQEQAIICLSREWEKRKFKQKDEQAGSILSSALVSQVISQVDSADTEMRQVTADSSSLVSEMDLLSAQFEKLIDYLRADSIKSSISFEYGFHSQKRELLKQILHLKSRLITLQETATLPEPTG
ncbi:hypothetical protein ACFL32_00200 [Candidatus Neomarinimicrobiota bacterium]